MMYCRKSSIVILIYAACILVHLATARIDDKIGLIAYNNATVLNVSKRKKGHKTHFLILLSQVTADELSQWTNLSFWRSMLGFLAWIIVGLAPGDDMLYVHLKNMEKYIPNN